MTWSASIQALIHYGKMRGHVSAEPGIRWLAAKLLEAAEPLCPEYLGYFEWDFCSKTAAPILTWMGPDRKPRKEDLERIAELEARLDTFRWIGKAQDAVPDTPQRVEGWIARAAHEGTS